MKQGARISIVCSSFPPERGAAPSRMFLLASSLREKGWAVQVITAMPNYPTGKIFPDYRGKFYVRENVEGIEVHRLWLIPENSSSKVLRAISMLSYAATLWLKGKKLIAKFKPDLLLVSSPPLITGRLGCAMGKQLGIKTVLNVSDLWPDSAKDLGVLREGSLLRLLRKAEAKMYRDAFAFSAQSEHIAAHIQKFRPEAKCFVYRNLQDTTPFADLPRPEGKRKIVYAGLLGIAQGVAQIAAEIDFAAAGTALHIYGSGFEEDKIAALARTKNDVFFHGSVSPQALSELMRNYHAMLVPLSTEIPGAVPSKIFAALAHGLPLIFCGSGEGEHIVRENGLGFCSPAGAINALQKNIKLFTEMPQAEYESLRENCLHAGRTKFCKTTQDAAWESFLSGLL